MLKFCHNFSNQNNCARSRLPAEGKENARRRGAREEENLFRVPVGRAPKAEPLIQPPVRHSEQKRSERSTRDGEDSENPSFFFSRTAADSLICLRVSSTRYLMCARTFLTLVMGVS